MVTYRVEKVRRRYWWPHPIYREARKYGYTCLHRWLPCADVTVNYKYEVSR